MKRLLLALTIATASFVAFTSCTKEYITQEHYDMVPAQTMIYSKTATDYPWNWGETDNRAYFTLPIPELTAYYMDQGIVSVAISEDNESTYRTIPATVNGISYSYDYKVGSVIIYAEDPIMEPGSEISVPNDLVVKVSLIDADYVE